ncbi:MAG: ribose-phosphate diphosphokinase [Candidatus Thorarchaeota archaeon]
MNGLRLFGLGSSVESKRFAQKVSQNLAHRLNKHVEKRFTDGETYIKSKDNVRNCDCYIITSLHTDEEESVDQKIIKLMWFIGSLVDATARSITIVTPYLAYQRQDRKTQSREGVVSKYLSIILASLTKESNFTTLRLMTMDVHNLSAFQNGFRVPIDNLEAKNPLVDYICGGSDRDGVPIEHHIPNPLCENPENIMIISPDNGGMGRAKRFRNSVEKRLGLQNQIGVAMIDKERISGDEVRGSQVVGDVEGKRVIMCDDMIAGGGTVVNTKNAVEAAGGELWGVCATHGVFVGNAAERLQEVPRVIVTDTIAQHKKDWNGSGKKMLYVVPTAQTFAQAIQVTHEGGSISEILEG